MILYVILLKTIITFVGVEQYGTTISVSNDEQPVSVQKLRNCVCLGARESVGLHHFRRGGISGASQQHRHCAAHGL